MLRLVNIFYFVIREALPCLSPCVQHMRILHLYLYRKISERRICNKITCRRLKVPRLTCLPVRLARLLIRFINFSRTLEKTFVKRQWEGREKRVQITLARVTAVTRVNMWLDVAPSFFHDFDRQIVLNRCVIIIARSRPSSIDHPFASSSISCIKLLHRNIKLLEM